MNAGRRPIRCPGPQKPLWWTNAAACSHWPRRQCRAGKPGRVRVPGVGVTEMDLPRCQAVAGGRPCDP